MISAGDFRNGVTFEEDGNVCQIVEFQHVKPGKGAAFVRTKLKNLRTGATIEHTFNSAIKVETARIERQDMQFLYSMGDTYYFMNMEDYSQIELNKNSLGDDKDFLKENINVTIVSYEGEILGLNLPDKIEMKVIKTEPAVKGNTTSSVMKDATLETGMEIKVPIFIDEGESIIISTKDREYVSRA